MQRVGLNNSRKGIFTQGIINSLPLHAIRIDRLNNAQLKPKQVNKRKRWKEGVVGEQTTKIWFK